MYKLSTGTYHKRVPLDPVENLQFRKFVIESCRNNPDYRAAVLEMCRQDILFFVNVFIWEYNPRFTDERSVGPWICWDFQYECFLALVHAIELQEDCLIEKSREMGASWICLIVFMWFWLFRPWSKLHTISRSELAVEAANPDSLFWKIDFALSFLPLWLLPKSWERTKLYYGNRDNGSSITGEASTGSAGVGGRATAMFIDEFSQIKEDYEVLHRTSDTTGCRIFNGTHRGGGRAFAELAKRVDLKKIVIHWSQHPEKRKGLYRYDADRGSIVVLDKKYKYARDFEFVYTEAPAGGPHPGLRSPWYDRECLRKGSPRAVAMDLDIDPGGSVSQFFNPLTLRSLIATYCTRPFWEGDIVFDRDNGDPERFVAVPNGPVKLWVNLLPTGKPPPSIYGAGADISTGAGATCSCLTVADARTGEKVCEFATPHLTPEQFALACIAICRTFKDEDDNPTFLSWEHAGPGLKFARQIIDAGYRRIYHREPAAVGLTMGDRYPKNPGWVPQNDQKRILLEDYRSALDARTFINRSEEAMRECLEFHYTQAGTVEHSSEQKKDDPTGARVNHGDRTIADALANKMIRGKLIMRAVQEEVNRVAPGSLAWRRQLVEQREAEAAAW
jgi:hypothetical protein